MTDQPSPTPVPVPGPDELVQIVIPQRLVRVFERRVLFAAGTLIGPLVGAGVWTLLRQGLQNVDLIAGIWKLVLGLVFVLLITGFRRGLVGAAVSLDATTLSTASYTSASLVPSISTSNIVWTWTNPTGAGVATDVTITSTMTCN